MAKSPSTQPSVPPTKLILVCCHAIFVGPSTWPTVLPPSTVPSTQSSTSTSPDKTIDPSDPTQWLLQPFQATESPTFISHTRTGLDLLRTDPSAILVFSGGRTRSAQGCQVSEAEGYARVVRWILDHEYTGNQESGVDDGGEGKQTGDGNVVDKEELISRIYLEEWATDSFQNVLFAVVGWGIWTGRAERSISKGPVVPSISTPEVKASQHRYISLPSKLTIISHAFKRPRFLELHLPAIRELLPMALHGSFDEMEVEYVGIDPPFGAEERKEVVEGEKIRGYAPWVGDRFGRGDVLDRKRRGRGWDGGIGYLGWWREMAGTDEWEGSRAELERMVCGKLVDESGG